MWSVLTMKYNSAIKRNEVLIHATAWVYLGKVMISERSQLQKTPFIYTTFPVQANPCPETESR